MIFSLDENVSHKIAKALEALGRNVVHLYDVLPRGTEDPEMLAELGRRGLFLITQDKKIKRKSHERRALIQAKVGAFIFMGRADKSVDDLMVKILGHMDEFGRLAQETERPFIFGIPDRGKKIERLG